MTLHDGTVIGGYRRVAEVDHLHIGSVAFCYVKEEGLDWSRETHIYGGPCPWRSGDYIPYYAKAEAEKK